MSTVLFEELDLNPQVLRAIKEMGFEEATPIQAQSIPAVMSGRDVIGQAQTGTGKTASFGIPLLHKVDPKLKKTQAIILCPTRELAIQVSNELHNLAKYMHGIRILPIYGGQDISRQIRSLKGGVQIIVGTPGRVMDHLRRKTIRCDFVNTIVLDEADEMLNMGFREDIETVLEYLPKEHQTVLFSATMPKAILDITKKYQKDAVTIKVVKKELTVKNIEQYYYDVRRKDKLDVLTRLLDVYDPKLSLVFCNTKHMVDELANELQNRGYFAEGLHGDMKQQQRDRVMRNFRNGKTEILVATDVAARGIDVDDVEAVFNYDTNYLTSYGIGAKPYILALGRLTPEKGFHDLIEAFAQSGLSKKIDLVIAGSAEPDNQYANKLKQAAKEASVLMPGFVSGSALHQLLTHANLFVLPSYNEGLPIALLEALSYNLDVVVSDIEPNKLDLIDSDCFFQLGNIDALAEKLIKKALKGTKYTYDLSQFNWDRIAELTASVYDNL